MNYVAEVEADLFSVEQQESATVPATAPRWGRSDASPRTAETTLR